MIDKCKTLIEKLEKTNILSKEEYLFLIENRDDCKEFLFQRARCVREQIYGKDIYIRGLIEFTNICKNNCYYCGIRRGNLNCQRYRLTPEEIIECSDTRI